MSKLVRIDVLPVCAGKRGWLVHWKQKDGSSEISSSEYFPRSKPTAIRAAQRQAAQLGGASVRIHGKNGRIQEERTYPRSRDPRRSKG